MMSGYSKEELLKMNISDLDTEIKPNEISSTLTKLKEQIEDRF